MTAHRFLRDNEDGDLCAECGEDMGAHHRRPVTVYPLPLSLKIPATFQAALDALALLPEGHKRRMDASVALRTSRIHQRLAPLPAIRRGLQQAAELRVRLIAGGGEDDQ